MTARRAVNQCTRLCRKLIAEARNCFTTMKINHVNWRLDMFPRAKFTGIVSMLIVIASTLTDLSHIVADFWPFELSYRYYLNEEEKLYPQAN